MNKVFIAAVLVAAATVPRATDPVSPPPAPAPVSPAPFILPPTPPPPPSPGVPIQLLPGHPYPIRLNGAIVLASPEGIVRLKTYAEPKSFIDPESGDVTEFTGDKSVCLVWPAKGASGACELLVVPSDGSAVGRVQLVIGTPTPPNPPAPTDPLTASLQAAYTADAATDKAASLVSLKTDYTDILAAIPGYYQTIPSPTVAQATQWMGSVVASLTPTLTPAKLTGVRKAIAADFSTALGSTLTAPVDQTKFAAEVARINNALQGVK